MPTYYRYSRWDGLQDLGWLDADEIMHQVADDLLGHGDLNWALRRLLQHGFQGRGGQQMRGLRDLMEQVRQQRQQQLNQYNLQDLFKDIEQRLAEILDLERQAIEQRLAPPEADEEPSPEMAAARKAAEHIARKKQDFLDQLPPALADKLKALGDYDFLSPTAREMYDQLMANLQKQILDSYFEGLRNSLANVSPEDQARLQEMVKRFNELLRQKMNGAIPDFDNFMREFGDLFGSEPPEDLDELIEQTQKRIAQMQSLLDSLRPEQRQQLMQMAQEMMGQAGMQRELQQLAAALEHFYPMRPFRREQEFGGDESLSFEQAMDVMKSLQELDELERQLTRAQQGGLGEVDEDLLAKQLGEEASRELETMRRLQEMLEEAGYIEQQGNQYELTPKGMRKIGQKALEDLFARLKKDGFGQHNIEKRGIGGDREETTKSYEFGDPFHLHLERTLGNALRRGEGAPPIHLEPNDFEVYQTRQLSHSATVLMLDMSWSMGMRGNFLAAKKVALALDNLIRAQFPRDSLYVVGFSDLAREMKQDALARSRVEDYVYGTNMQHALMLARQFLSRQKGGNKQIIMITDGEPTAHFENGHLYFDYPPSLRTIQLTLREAKRCTRAGIVINTFMLDRSYYLKEFVDQLTRINHGRAFYTTPDRLGQYVLVDYLSSKRKHSQA